MTAYDPQKIADYISAMHAYADTHLADDCEDIRGLAKAAHAAIYQIHIKLGKIGGVLPCPSDELVASRAFVSKLAEATVYEVFAHDEKSRAIRLAAISKFAELLDGRINDIKLQKTADIWQACDLAAQETLQRVFDRAKARLDATFIEKGVMTGNKYYTDLMDCFTGADDALVARSKLTGTAAPTMDATLQTYVQGREMARVALAKQNDESILGPMGIGIALRFVDFDKRITERRLAAAELVPTS